MKKQQQGGTILGFILGLVVGLGAAFAVAVYVTKVPVPFLNKGVVRGTEKDAAEDVKNKDWDPNAPLYGKNPARPAPADPATATPSANEPTAKPSPAESKPAADTKTATKPEGKAESSKAEAKPDPKVDAKTSASTSADPLGDLAKSRANTPASTTNAADEPFTYFLQTGAFATQADADAQRAKLAMMGWEARVSEREQNGSTVFRVRVGPFSKRGDAETRKEKLDSSGIDSALVRVQR